MAGVAELTGMLDDIATNFGGSVKRGIKKSYGIISQDWYQVPGLDGFTYVNRKLSPFILFDKPASDYHVRRMHPGFVLDHCMMVIQSYSSGVSYDDSADFETLMQFARNGEVFGIKDMTESAKNFEYTFDTYPFTARFMPDRIIRIQVDSDNSCFNPFWSIYSMNIFDAMECINNYVLAGTGNKYDCKIDLIQLIKIWISVSYDAGLFPRSMYYKDKDDIIDTVIDVLFDEQNQHFGLTMIPGSRLLFPVSAGYEGHWNYGTVYWALKNKLTPAEISGNRFYQTIHNIWLDDNAFCKESLERAEKYRSIDVKAGWFEAFERAYVPDHSPYKKNQFVSHSTKHTPYSAWVARTISDMKFMKQLAKTNMVGAKWFTWSLEGDNNWCITFEKPMSNPISRLDWRKKEDCFYAIRNLWGYIVDDNDNYYKPKTKYNVNLEGTYKALEKLKDFDSAQFGEMYTMMDKIMHLPYNDPRKYYLWGAYKLWLVSAKDKMSFSEYLEKL